MKLTVSTGLACLLLAACCPVRAAAPDCTHDRERLLALDEDAFDQDMRGGWRPLGGRPGCELAAADLLRDYRARHGSTAGILFWHEGQLRAFAGQRAQAATLMEASRRAPGVPDGGGWNPYLDATVAYLRGDRAAFDAARARLAALPPVAEAGVKDGVMETDLPDGSKMRMRWPPNIDVVDGLGKCFDKPYGEAYSMACRPPAP